MKKKKPGEELESSQQSIDRGDATPVRDEPMDEVPSPVKTPPISSKPQAGETTKSPASKSTAAATKPSAKSASKPQSDKSKKDKNQKVKAKVKTECVKSKSDKMKKNGDGVINKKDSLPSTATKPQKTLKVKSEDASKSTNPKKEKSKSSSSRPGLLKTPPLSSQNPPLHHPSVHDGLQPSHDTRGRRDIPQGGGLLPLPTQHGHALAPPLDCRRRMGEDSRSLLGSPPGKLRRTDNLGGELMPHPHMSHQPLLNRLPHFERPGLLPLPGSREMARGDVDRGPIRPLIDLQVGLLLISCWTFPKMLVKYVITYSSFKVGIVSIAQLNLFVTHFFSLCKAIGTEEDQVKQRSGKKIQHRYGSFRQSSSRF